MWRGTDKYGGKCRFACEKSLCQLTLELCNLTFAGLEVLKMWRLTMADNHTDQSAEVARARKKTISQESHIIHSACRSCVNSVKKGSRMPWNIRFPSSSSSNLLAFRFPWSSPQKYAVQLKNTSCMYPQPQYFIFSKSIFFNTHGTHGELFRPRSISSCRG